MSFIKTNMAAEFLVFTQDDWQWFLHHPNISIFNKSFWIFYLYGIKNIETRNMLKLSRHFAPWNYPESYVVWSYHEEYAFDRGELSINEAVIMWKKMMDFWCKDLLHNDYFYISEVDLIPGIHDVGVFSNGVNSLETLSNNLYGYSEEVPKLLFDDLNERQFFSLYSYSEVSDNSRYTSRQFTFAIIFGVIACCNSDLSSGNFFAHRNMISGEAERLVSRIEYSSRSHVYNENCLTAFVRKQIKSEVLSSDEIENFELLFLNTIVYEQAASANLVTKSFDLTRTSHIPRVVFGKWRQNKIVDYIYDDDEQILINYSLRN